MATKVCSKCHVEKDINKFYKRENSKDGHESSCINCRKQYKENRKETYKLTTIIPDFKQCKKCLLIHSNSNFSPNPYSSDGLKTECKNCRNNSSKVQNLKNSCKYQNNDLSGTKECCICKTIYSKTDFYNHPSSNDLLLNFCKKC